jgi:uncharacterized protein (DUF2235 family)
MKNIVFCADGTWNGPGQDHDHDRVADPTNVFKTFANLAGIDTAESTRLADEQERVLADEGDAVVQVAKYLHGVGDSSNFLVKALGGAAGAGLITRIVRGYTFVSRNYSEGDRIFLIGFSRGAYTARALAGLIAARGLLDATRIDLTNKNQAYRLGSAEWFEYRRRALRSKQRLFDRFAEIVVDLPGFVSHPSGAPRIEKVPIEAVAVWDTVGALGIPLYDRDVGQLDAFQFADTALSPTVRHALHAVALDEQRNNFTPTLWDDDPRVLQVIFPGAHCDVGGGFPIANDHSGLSDAGLEWMTCELASLGVAFASKPTYVPNPDPARGSLHQTWLEPPWHVLPSASRKLRPGLALHRSVIDRLACTTPALRLGPGPWPYEPRNLAGYIVEGVPIAGVRIVPEKSPPST